MGWKVIEFESTPNPRAVKCQLDRTISSQPLSCRDVTQAAELPIARDLFANGATSVLLCDDWITVNIETDRRWPDMKKIIRRVLAAADEADVTITS